MCKASFTCSWNLLSYGSVSPETHSGFSAQCHSQITIISGQSPVFQTKLQLHDPSTATIIPLVETCQYPCNNLIVSSMASFAAKSHHSSTTAPLPYFIVLLLLRTSDITREHHEHLKQPFGPN